MPTNPGKSSVSAIVGASIAAVGASVCCVVPLALVLLGISGAWIGNLTALDPWRPWLSAAALLSLGLAFWSLYGPPSRCRAEGQCVDPGTLKRSEEHTSELQSLMRSSSAVFCLKKKKE